MKRKLGRLWKAGRGGRLLSGNVEGGGKNEEERSSETAKNSMTLQTREDDLDSFRGGNRKGV